MKKVTVRVSTNRIGSECETSFNVEDGEGEESIEEFARLTMFDMISWDYKIEDLKSSLKVGKQPTK